METLTLNQLTKVVKKQDTLKVSGKTVFYRKLIASMLLMSADIIAIYTSLFLSFLIRDSIFGNTYEPLKYLSYTSYMLPIFICTYYFRNLYPSFGVDAVSQLKNLLYSTAGVYLILASTSFFIQEMWEFSRGVYLLSGLMAIFFIPLARSAIRNIFGSKDWWGIPVIVLGAGQAGEKAIKALRKNKLLGLKPYLAIDDDSDKWGYIDNVPVIGGLDTVKVVAEQSGIDHVIIAMPKVDTKKQDLIINKYGKFFEHVILIPDLFAISSFWVKSTDLGGILGLEVHQKLMRRGTSFLKRGIDLTLGFVLTLITLPLIMIIAAAIMIDSKGKVFFIQERMGINDSRFKMVKFRTMHIDAEERLNEILENDSELKKEYEIYHKLTNDPRLTRVGKFLRKYSIDELPQLWNVLKGEMSLIGPRAYMPWEKIKMQGNDNYILMVKPGMSGLWQVTDRHRSSFEERNSTDVYYIRNWSLFMDIYILARTVSVVFSGKGE